MNKFAVITFIILGAAVVASAATKGAAHQCVPEPITMFVLIPGVAMFIRKRKQA